MNFAAVLRLESNMPKCTSEYGSGVSILIQIDSVHKWIWIGCFDINTNRPGAQVNMDRAFRWQSQIFDLFKWSIQNLEKKCIVLYELIIWRDQKFDFARFDINTNRPGAQVHNFLFYNSSIHYVWNKIFMNFAAVLRLVIIIFKNKTIKILKNLKNLKDLT
jgi:hypothetical protein